MKDFHFFEDVNEYRNYMRDVMLQSVLRDDPFYSGLVDWVIDNRTPMMFEQSDPCEYSHFSQYFGLMLRRDYSNRFLNDLYYAHDLIHMTQHNPPYPMGMSFEKFLDLVTTNEYYASSETEILTYVRRPELRGDTFQFTILYDLLLQNNWDNWGVDALAELERLLTNGSVVWEFLGSYAETRNLRVYMDHKDENWVWTKNWWNETPYLNCNPTTNGASLPYGSYFAELNGYRSILTQREYEQNMSKNVNFWYKLTVGNLFYTIRSFSPLRSLLDQMEGKIVLPNAARSYHEMNEARRAGAVQP